MKNVLFAAAAAAAIAAAAPANASTTVAWTGGSNFDDNTYTTFAGVNANTVQFFGSDSSYGEGVVGPMAHTHGQTMTYTIHAVVDGVDQTIFSRTLGGTGSDVADSIAGLGALSFTGGLVTAIGFGCQNCSYNTYHQFSDTTFTLSSVAGGVPEPATWALMILGMGAVGGAMRRRSATKMTVRFA